LDQKFGPKILDQNFGPKNLDQKIWTKIYDRREKFLKFKRNFFGSDKPSLCFVLQTAALLRNSDGLGEFHWQGFQLGGAQRDAFNFFDQFLGSIVAAFEANEWNLDFGLAVGRIRNRWWAHLDWLLGEANLSVLFGHFGHFAWANEFTAVVFVFAGELSKALLDVLLFAAFAAFAFVAFFAAFAAFSRAEFVWNAEIFAFLAGTHREIAALQSAAVIGGAFISAIFVVTILFVAGWQFASFISLVLVFVEESADVRFRFEIRSDEFVFIFGFAIEMSADTALAALKISNDIKLIN
jgi:hypothetical protein